MDRFFLGTDTKRTGPNGENGTKRTGSFGAKRKAVEII